MIIISKPATSLAQLSDPLKSLAVEVMHERKRTKTVSFDVNVSVCEILNLSCYSDQELTNCWYRPAEILRGKREMFETLQLLQTGRYTGDDEHYCSRGLENRVCVTSLEKKKNRLNACLVVMEEQEIQRYQGIVSEEAIALVYKQATSHCAGDAMLKGRMDEVDAHSPESASEQKAYDQAKIHTETFMQQRSWKSLSRIIARGFSVANRKRKNVQ